MSNFPSESPEARFDHLSQQRLTSALNAMRQIGTLSSRADCRPTADIAGAMISTLRDAVDNLEVVLGVNVSGSYGQAILKRLSERVAREQAEEAGEARVVLLTPPAER
ncbi:hypothetical protein SAMN04488498_101413 [Mesorhizobium albiziae]|uniref:Uncharacterized protein n=1 Tax=Neomesorhizobium albiziae TaxID=335020 RepID=A0A1I3VEU8_9HYPH|nr:hypothetical protein GCM10007937_05790 [Mesorhizobium albiziae]SFJ93898.1 hypothetical protein SAMN04488498_101413 [Mesorhizobium albiziae]